MEKEAEQTDLCAHPTLWRTLWPGWNYVCRDYFGGAPHSLESPLERGEGDQCSDSYFVARQSGVRLKKYT